MQNLKFYQKYPGLISFLISLILFLIITIFLMEIRSVINLLMKIADDNLILGFAFLGSLLLGIYALILLIIRLIRKKMPILFYLLTVSIVFIMILFCFYISIIDRPNTSHYDTKRISDIRQIKLALGMYIDKYKIYPDVLEELVNKGFISSLPRDPISGKRYGYNLNGDKTFFVLKTVLDGKKTVALKDDLDGMIFGIDCDDPAYCIMSK